MSVQYQILLSRFLTRFGDQAWDFAVPLVLIGFFPGKLHIVAIYFLCIKTVQLFLTPSVMNSIDRWSRKKIFKFGIGSQTAALVFSWFVVVTQAEILRQQSMHSWMVLVVLILLGIISTIGSSLMEISVGFDLAVDYLEKKDLPLFNSRLKRFDLMTEVAAPFFAGLLLLLSYNGFPFLGFTIIALMNLVSFFPEYKLLSSLVDNNPKSEKLFVEMPKKFDPIKEFLNGFKEFNDQRYAIPMIAYSFLWLSVLSPHGVLLAGYLKDTAHLSETEIGVFRGFGALFGLLPTFLFTKFRDRGNLKTTAMQFLCFQAICVILAAGFFTMSAPAGMYLFMLAVLLSRVGLYGFSIAEAEARQTFIPFEIRGKINGFGVSLTSFATLFLFVLGSLLPSSADFKYLVFASAAFVVIGLFVLQKWKVD